MFGIDFVRPDGAIGASVLTWNRMQPHAKRWAEAALRATTIEEFSLWFTMKIEAVAYDDGFVVMFERPHDNVAVAHPFVSPSLRDRRRALRSFVRDAGDILHGLEIELHLCDDVSDTLRDDIVEVGFLKVGQMDDELVREATPRRLASSTVVEKWRILL